MKFRKSSRSIDYKQGEHCVEVAPGECVMVRDSKNPSEGTLHVSRGAWESFVRGVGR